MIFECVRCTPVFCIMKSLKEKEKLNKMDNLKNPTKMGIIIIIICGMISLFIF